MHSQTQDTSTHGTTSADALALVAQLHTLFDVAPDMLCIASLDGTVTLINPAWEAITGHSIAALLGAPFLDFFHPEDRERVREQFAGLRLGEAVRECAARFRCADDTYHWLSFDATPSDGFAYSVVRDITEQYEANQRVVHYQSALRRNAAMIDASLMQATELLRQLHSLHRIVLISLSAAAGEADAALDAHREAAPESSAAA